MRTRTTAAGVLLGTAMTLLVVGPAAAHVTVTPGEAPADGYARLTFRVPHGCEGEATNVLEVAIPDGVVSVKPEQVVGWAVETEVGPYDEPVEIHGSEVTEGVKVVTWTADEGQELPDDLFREFGLSVKLPAGEAGDELVFPAVQTCVDGEEEAWIETSDDPDAHLDYPAPIVTLTAGGGGHGAAADEDEAHDDEDASAAGETVTTEPAAASDTGTDPLVWAALGVGFVGLGAGVAGLRAARR
ncbi:YcnI family protein [Nitriliruptoraceae bacterium ZYF776]|nr:YcnI family protein [Profundirhabdus halotolerans]